MDSAIQSVAPAAEQLSAPAQVFNCPNCSRWQPEGTLVCPECETILYSDHLRGIALVATAEENSGNWIAAKGVWSKALAWLPPETKQYAAVQQRIGLIDARLRSAEESKAKWTRRLGPLAPVVFFLAKLKTALFFLLKFKFFLSFAGFFAIYWFIFGWKFGLGFTVAILIHEMGHYIAAKMRGLKVDLPVFLPGLGAYVRWYSQGITLDTLSGIALAGPLFGLLCAAAFGATSHLLHEPPIKGGLFSALAHVSAWLNLLNLVPILGLDGAQATYALNRMQRGMVMVTAIVFFAWLHEWTFLCIAIGMAWRLYTGGYPERPSSKTLVHYVLLIFALGVVVYLFPDTSSMLQRRY